MSFASLFTGGPGAQAPLHTFETDSEDAPPAPKSKSPKEAQEADTFLDIDGIEVADNATVARWARAIENRYLVEVRYIVGVGHHVNRYGCWAIERWTGKEGGGYERLRLADATQMREIYEALGKNSTKFWELANGETVDGEFLPGPYREGRPPVDAKGNPVQDQPSRGDHGPLPDECRWIETHDETFIEYLGTDVNWPNGCWQVEKSGFETQHLDMDGIKYVAHNILGMPTAGQTLKAQWRKAKRQAHTNGSSFASLFAEPSEAPPEDLLAASSDWGDPAQSTPLADLLSFGEWSRGPKPYGGAEVHYVTPFEARQLAKLGHKTEEAQESTASFASLFV